MLDLLLKSGQVWEWCLLDQICETYLLLHSVEHVGDYWSSRGAFIEMWEALNLETGEIELITPEQTAGSWIQLG